MKHLDVDDILNFVSMTELNSEAMELSSKVNSHIRHCKKCLELVRAFQTIYDEFESCNKDNDFKKYVANNLDEYGIEVNNEVAEIETENNDEHDVFK